MIDEQMAQGQTAAPETKRDEAKERTWTDAPVSANVRACINGRDWQITIRTDTFKELSERIPIVNDWLSKHNGKSQEKPAQATPPAQPQAVTPAAPSAPGAPAGQPQVAATAQIFIMIAETMETTPRADGKVDAKFYQTGHQYPDIYATKTPDILCQMLAATGEWTPGHFVAAAKFPVKMAIEWINSDKLNKNGKPYKNIVSIKAAQ